MPRLFLAIAVVLASFPLFALDPTTAGQEYARLQRWRFSLPVPLPAGGVTIARDSATWTLQSGSVRLMEPMADGTITGLYFEGQGRFRMTIPDRYELAQLRRFAAKPELQEIDQPITQLVLRTSDASVAKLFPAAAGDPFSPARIDNRDKVRNVGADVANSMQYFQGLLGDTIDVPEFYVTSIAAGHGQAFEGFLHMTESTFDSEHPGASELFRAHEVAHEWFGHKIGWATYRDQWLSEALAEYAAMMFVQGFVKGGEKHFEEMLRSYDGIIRGLPLGGGFSKFNRPWLAATSIRAVDRERVGPIGHGWRANTAEIRGYWVQSYSSS